jgi:phosphoglycolate phosphatase-like HAD superfamily hydrolase
VYRPVRSTVGAVRSAEPARGVVFDLDGTLVDTMTTVPRAYVDTVRDLGGPTVEPGEVVAAWHVGPAPAVLAHLLGRAVSPEDLEVYHHHVDAAVATVRPFAGVIPLLRDLELAGYRLGVFTGAGRRAALLLLAGAGLDGFFPVVVCGDDVAKPKPAPDGLLLACRRLRVDAADSAYVGDAEVDRCCAEAAGALPIHAAWGGHSAAAAGCGHSAAGPAPVARRPREVLDLLG